MRDEDTGIYLMVMFALIACAIALTITIPVVSAEQQSLGVFKTNECVTLIQTCSNCTYVTVNTIAYPNSTNALGAAFNMTKAGTLYTVDYCNTSVNGEYTVFGYGDLDGETTVWNYNFLVTPTGDEVTFGGSIIIIGIIIILVIAGAFLFVLGGSFDILAAKIFFVFMAGICLLFSIAIGVNAVQSYLTFFTGLNTIVNYFWYLIMILGVGGVILGCFWGILYALDQFKVSRGLEGFSNKPNKYGDDD